MIKSRSVLIVEDEWLVRLELTSAFEDAGFAVTESGSAEEALDILRTRPVALLLTDIRLDGQMNGWDLAEEARTQWPDISVIYLSANPPLPDKVVKGARFIDKPARMGHVIETAGRLLAGCGD